MVGIWELLGKLGKFPRIPKIPRIPKAGSAFGNCWELP